MRLYYSIYNIMTTSKSTKKRKKNIRIKTRKAQKNEGGARRRIELTPYPSGGSNDAVSENKNNNTRRQAWVKQDTEEEAKRLINRGK